MGKPSRAKGGRGACEARKVLTSHGYYVEALTAGLASHDLTGEPPYADLDLISCRNVMIYFDTAQQRAVFARFHAALRPGGLLLLGRSESNLAAGRRFEPVDKSHRLYRKVEG